MEKMGDEITVQTRNLTGGLGGGLVLEAVDDDDVKATNLLALLRVITDKPVSKALLWESLRKAWSFVHYLDIAG
ncbi:hypothetical protein CJ030_MR8G004989 [Morella rubra]|uniref:Uncharacterized protein n=1 Tax=Morella rubra TaxID=262757 RepID=A0A6A1URW2_9ROSI|nr:hypothetical protein CJ030_MR8G004989 [Morella rubra]